MGFIIFYIIQICVGLDTDQCQTLQSSYCRQNNQSQTHFPNINSRLNWRSQDDVDRYFQSPGSIITTLLEDNCHGELHFFACMYHFPVCSEALDREIYPCRELCLDIKETCMRLAHLIKLVCQYIYNHIQ